ncbi:LolA-like outer membrane lipoprotein chaperone [Nitratiruptor sp. YY09-18]|uniref:LolA-like outer membrane lipoprotein chaperone n=1 Tax=Nitratiruptor sp. YY09-18 TaxID=2724901 RepID=UPI0019165159|nr:LolA-like outer membrane lipoprotein chaperone [Nitratiruptor sp. YY09-18]BCD68046.1 outer membrane lipoprotein carrier protein [Nitratiruptor sp. YY09-18]
MRFIAIFFAIVIANLYAKINIASFHSPFIQTVINDQNRTLRYEGEVWFTKEPLRIKWIYKKPNYKEIYINNQKVYIIEPDLEQVVVKRVQKKDNFFTILDSAVLVKGKQYKAFYDGHDIFIDLKNGKISKVTYTDKLENKNSILFTHPQQNIPLDDSNFTIEIKSDWDVIEE